MQQVTITGRLGKDPEIKYFESGKVKTNFTLATSGYDSKAKEKTTNWFNIDIWDKKAEFVAEHFKKGDSITVIGELKKETYTNSAGEEKTNWKINAYNASYDSSVIILNGIIEQIEIRYNSNNKKIQYIKLKNSDIRITYFNDSELTQGDLIVCFCELGMIDYKPVAKALKINVNKSEERTQAETDIGDSEIPF